MLFLLEILEFIKVQSSKIDEILKKDLDKSAFIFPVAYGISLWSQMLKSSGAGDSLGFSGLLIGILVTGSLVGMLIFYFFPFILSRVSKIFTEKGDFKSCQKIFAWCQSPFIISALLVIIEFLMGGQKIYTKAFINSNGMQGFVNASTTFISMFFAFLLIKSFSYVWQIKWWKSLIIIFLSAAITMLPTFLLHI